MPSEDRIQLHLELPFHKQPRDHPKVAALLRQGFRIAELQRVTDDEVAVTLARSAAGASAETSGTPPTHGDR